MARDASGRFTSSRPDEMQRIEVAAAAGLPATWAPRLRGDNLDELTADAVELAGVVGAQAPAEQAPVTMTDVIRGEIARKAGRGAPAPEPRPGFGGSAQQSPMSDLIRDRVAGRLNRGAPPAEPAPVPPGTGGGFDGGPRGDGTQARGSSADEAIRSAFGRRH